MSGNADNTRPEGGFNSLRFFACEDSFMVGGQTALADNFRVGSKYYNQEWALAFLYGSYVLNRLMQLGAVFYKP